MIFKDCTNNINFLKIEGNYLKDTILIFLPGIGTYKENYISHLKQFVSYYKFIYSIDLPQQGSKGEWTIGCMVDNLKEFINTIDNSTIKNIHLSGHSAGALNVISFLVNYNIANENIVLNSKTNLNNNLKKSDFGQKPKEAKKVNKIFLYSPPDSFNIVFPDKLSNSLKKRSHNFVKKRLNFFVNYPMKFLGVFNNDLKFSFSELNEIQYYNLSITNHVSFLNYITGYKTIFELAEDFDLDLKKKILKNLKDIYIYIQYGSLDWVIKPYSKKRKLNKKYLKLDINIKIKRHKYLGHLLNKKFHLDINMNSQMLINKDLIEFSINKLYL